jgi:hypothetical protein
MGVRVLEGSYDGTTAAVMVDSTNGWTIGPVFEGASAPDDIEEFLSWLEREPYLADAGLIGLETPDLPHPERRANDPRVWPDAGLQKLVEYWRREAWSGREAADG